MLQTGIPLRFIQAGGGHDILLEKRPAVLKPIKDAFKRVQQLDWDRAEDYLIFK